MQKRKTVTLKAVAERTGISIQTVSAVLNGSRSNTVVSAETRTRIFAVAEEMQYQRNALASSLRRGYTNIIGFYTGYGTVSQSNSFIAEIFGGIQAGCHQHRKDLLIHGTFRGDSVDDIYDELTSGKIDGLVIFSPENNALVQRLQAALVPVVAIAETLPGITSIVMNDWESGSQVAQHLHEQGHRHVLYRHSPRILVSARHRLEGLQAQAGCLGMTVTAVQTEELPVHTLSEQEKRLLLSERPDRPTAMVCWCDKAAIPVLQFLLDNNVSIPDHTAVVGFDGFRLSYPGGADLTTMVAPWAEAGQRAVTFLVEGKNRVDGSAGENIAALMMQFRRGTTT